jgi:phosphoribosyl 1,2-cyclic phosphodiesterase
VDFQIGDFNIHPVPLPHDAFEPLGFVVESENSRLLVATDLGFVTDKVLEEMAQCKAVIFESNHDVEMLQNGPYSPELKERILSRWGHLSNNQCAAALKKACWSGLKLVVLAHLSKENNMPSLALAESVKVLPKETKVLTASRINYTGPFRI